MKTLMLTLAMIGVAAPAAAQDRWRDDGAFRGRANVRSFEAPRIGGFPLDICPRDVGVDGLLRGRCGTPVANEFCRSRGFAEAVDAPHQGGMGPTRFITTGGIVDHPWATGFRYITCER